MIKLLISAVLLHISTCYPSVSLNIEYNQKILDSNLKLDYVNSNDLDNEEFIFYGKICYTNNYTQFNIRCKNAFDSYNTRWVLLVDDYNYLNILISNIKNKTENSSLAIIFNNYTITNKNFPNAKVNLLSANNNTFNSLKQWDIQKENLNYVVEIIYIIPIPIGLINILFYVNLGISFFLITTAIMWNRLIREHTNQSLQLQKSITFLPYLRVFISFVFCYYIYLYINSDGDNANLIMINYIGVIFLTLLSVYKTFFWFIILLLAYGWIIYKDTISRENLKKFVLYYIIIYILVFFDPFLDDIIKDYIFCFKVSDLKNFIIYTGFTIMIIKQAKNTYNKFLAKYYYAREFLPFFCVSLKLKMNMMIQIIILSIIYTFSYILIVSLIRQILPKNSNNVLFDSALKINEDLYLLSFLYIFRPRKFPLYFDLSLEDDLVNSSPMIYKISLRKNIELAISSDFGENINHETSNINTPIIIINPLCYSNADELNKINVLDKVSVCFNE